MRTLLLRSLFSRPVTVDECQIAVAETYVIKKIDFDYFDGR